MIKIATALSALLLISGCTENGNTSAPERAETAETGQPEHQRTDKWIGRWIGVEGLVVNISNNESEGAGHYDLQMQYGLDADQSGTFKGQATAEGISFNRKGEPHVLRAGDGEATGLKWLAEKQDCLIVQSGEGYCRD